MEGILGESFSKLNVSSERSKIEILGCDRIRKRTIGRKNSDNQDKSKKRRKNSRDERLFSPLGETVPIDEVAEASLQLEQDKRKSSVCTSQSSDDDNESIKEDLWLENVASILANAGKPKIPNSRSRKPSIEANSKTGSIASTIPSQSSERSKSIKSRKSEIKEEIAIDNSLQPLLDIGPGSRHGKKVFHVKDPKRIVGEVRTNNHDCIANCTIYVSSIDSCK